MKKWRPTLKKRNLPYKLPRKLPKTTKQSHKRFKNCQNSNNFLLATFRDLSCRTGLLTFLVFFNRGQWQVQHLNVPNSPVCKHKDFRPRHYNVMKLVNNTQSNNYSYCNFIQRYMIHSWNILLFINKWLVFLSFAQSASRMMISH